MTQKISNPQKALVLIDLYLVSQYEVLTPNRGRVMSEQSYYLKKKKNKKNGVLHGAFVSWLKCFAWEAVLFVFVPKT